MATRAQQAQAVAERAEVLAQELRVAGFIAEAVDGPGWRSIRVTLLRRYGPGLGTVFLIFLPERRGESWTAFAGPAAGPFFPGWGGDGHARVWAAGDVVQAARAASLLLASEGRLPA